MRAATHPSGFVVPIVPAAKTGHAAGWRTNGAHSKNSKQEFPMSSLLSQFTTEWRPENQKRSHATCERRGSGPWSFGTDGYFDITSSGAVLFGFSMNAEAHFLPTNLAGSDSWSALYSAWIAEKAVYDDQEFFAGSPLLMYAIHLAASSSGLSVNFMTGELPQFHLTVDQSESAIECVLHDALTDGWSGDKTFFSGSVNLRDYPSVSIGHYDFFDASRFSDGQTLSTLTVLRGRRCF